MLRQARCLYELKKYDEAGNLYWNVPRQFTQSKHYDIAVLAGAKCFYLAGKYERARSGLENVAKRDVPEAAEACQWIGRSLLKENNPQEALKVLDAAIAKHGSNPTFPQLVLARIDALYELPDRRVETVPLYAEFSQKYPQDELAAQAQYMSALTALEFDKHNSKGQLRCFRAAIPQGSPAAGCAVHWCRSAAFTGGICGIGTSVPRFSDASSATSQRGTSASSLGARLATGRPEQRCPRRT